MKVGGRNAKKASGRRKGEVRARGAPLLIHTAQWKGKVAP